MHRWSTVANDNQTSDPLAYLVEGQSASSLNNAQRGAMASVARWRDDNLGTLVATYSAGNVYGITTAQGIPDLTKPFSLVLKLSQAPTGAASLVVDGLPAKPLRLISGADVVEGEVVAGRYRTMYDPTAGEYLAVPADRLALSASLTSQVAFAAPGTVNWTCPPGVTKLKRIRVWGAGGGGGGVGSIGNGAAGGGGGGGYAEFTNVPVTPGQVYVVTVGQGGLSGAPGGSGGAGGSSSFSTLVSATGGGGGGAGGGGVTGGGALGGIGSGGSFIARGSSGGSGSSGTGPGGPGGGAPFGGAGAGGGAGGAGPGATGAFPGGAGGGCGAAGASVGVVGADGLVILEW